MSAPDDAFREVAERIYAEQERYTKEQLVTLVAEMIRSGDIVAVTTIATPAIRPCIDGISASLPLLTYVPYRERMRLDRENGELKGAVDEAADIIGRLIDGSPLCFPVGDCVNRYGQDLLPIGAPRAPMCEDCCARFWLMKYAPERMSDDDSK